MTPADNRSRRSLEHTLHTYRKAWEKSEAELASLRSSVKNYIERKDFYNSGEYPPRENGAHWTALREAENTLRIVAAASIPPLGTQEKRELWDDHDLSRNGCPSAAITEAGDGVTRIGG